MDEQGLIHFLEQHKIPYRRFDHPAVYTVEQAEAALPDIPGEGTKNLLLYDPAGDRYLLLMTLGKKRVDLKRFAAAVDAQKGLRFAPEESLEQFLGVGRGAVTALGLANDTAGRVELWVDLDLWQHEAVHCHPLVNTATLVIATRDLERFFELSGHTPNYIQVPEAGS